MLECRGRGLRGEKPPLIPEEEEEGLSLPPLTGPLPQEMAHYLQDTAAGPDHWAPKDLKRMLSAGAFFWLAKFYVAIEAGMPWPTWTVSANISARMLSETELLEIRGNVLQHFYRTIQQFL